MDTSLNEVQEAILGSVATLLARHRAKTGHGLPMDPEYDNALERELGDAGFLDVAVTGGSLLDAVLVTERVAREAANVPIGWRTVLWPALHSGSWPLVPCEAGGVRLVRFGSSASAIALLDEARDSVSIVDIAECEVRGAGAAWGYPVAHILPRGGGQLLAVTASECLARWRIALAAEIVGLAGAAFDHTIQYIKDRRQFGRPIGANQAIRHRAAHLAVELEKARYLTYEAAWRVPDAELAAAAATVAVSMAELMFQEAHQMHGAIGYTLEFPLHRWTLRLRVLCRELGGVSEHAVAVAKARASRSRLTRSRAEVQNEEHRADV